jgi:hypothetical protein
LTRPRLGVGPERTQPSDRRAPNWTSHKSSAEVLCAISPAQPTDSRHIGSAIRSCDLEPATLASESCSNQHQLSTRPRHGQSRSWIRWGRTEQAFTPTCRIGLIASRYSQAKPVVTSGPHESRAGVSDGIDQHSSWWNCARGNNVASCAHCTRKWSAIRRWYRIFPVSDSDFTCARPIHEHEGRTGRGRQAHCAKASIAWLVLVRGATAGGAVQGCRVRRTRAKLSMKIILPRPAPKRVCADRPRQWYVSVSI